MLGEKLKQIRKSKGLKQEDLAERSGFSRSSIINWETGKRAPRTVDIDRLAMALGVTPNDLIDGGALSAQNNGMAAKIQNFPTMEEDKNFMEFAYWGGVLDKAKKLVASGNLQAIMLITPLLHSALDILLSVQGQTGRVASLTTGVAVYSGDHSTYNNNSYNVGQTDTVKGE